MTTHIGDHKVFASLGPGDTVIGNHCIVRGGRGYTATGNHNQLYGTQITAIGNHLYVEGSDSTIRGNHLRVKGPRQDAAGTYIQLLGGATPHALPHAPAGAENKSRAGTRVVISDSTIGLMGEHARNEGLIVMAPAGARAGPSIAQFLGGGGGGGGVATRTRGRARDAPYPATPTAGVSVAPGTRGYAFSQREGDEDVEEPLVLGGGKYVFNQGIRIASGAARDGGTMFLSTSGARSPAYVSGSVVYGAPPPPSSLEGEIDPALVDEMISRLPDWGEATYEVRTSAPAAPIAYPPIPANGEPSELKEGTAVCSVCLERRVTTAAVPCGHAYSCVTCLHTARPTACAHCREPVTAFIRTYDASTTL
jgi:hypothetical protein